MFSAWPSNNSLCRNWFWWSLQHMGRVSAKLELQKHKGKHTFLKTASKLSWEKNSRVGNTFSSQMSMATPACAGALLGRHLSRTARRATYSIYSACALTGNLQAKEYSRNVSFLCSKSMRFVSGLHYPLSTLIFLELPALGTARSYLRGSQPRLLV